MESHVACDYFTAERLLSSESQPIFDGRYTLTVETYKTGDNSWEYTWGKVFDGEGNCVLSIQHNYSRFLHSELTVNGNDYMFTASSYDRGILVNLTSKKVKIACDSFCWMGGSISPDEKTLFVGGCCWAGPTGGFFYDISGETLVRLKCPCTPYGEQDDDEDGRPCEDGKSTVAKWVSDTEMELTVYEPYFPSLNVSEIDAHRQLIEDHGLKFPHLDEEYDKLDKLELIRRVVEVKRYRRDGNTVTEV